jgi:hypothetical protein
MAVWNDECRPWLGRLALLGEAQRADDNDSDDSNDSKVTV